MKSIRQKREIRSRGLVNPQIAPSTCASIPPSGSRLVGAGPQHGALPCRLQITRYSCNDE